MERRVISYGGSAVAVEYEGSRASGIVDFVYRYAPAGGSTPPLSKAQAGLELMQCLVNGRNLPGHGFAEVARLARSVPAHMLRYSRFEDLGVRIEELLRSA